MKKTTFNYGKIFFLLLLCLLGTDALAQSQFNQIVSGGSTSGNGRAPQGAARFNRTHLIITAAEMTAGGFAAGDRVSGVGFTYSTAQNIPTTGTLKVYLENTADASNLKSLTWANAIAGMTLVSDAPNTVPAALGDYNVEFSNGAPFTYTGGNLYVAFDYQNLNNTLSTANQSFCDTALIGGAAAIASVISTTATEPTTLTRSTFRAQIKLALPVSCARPTALGATNATATSADLTWTASAGGTGIELEFGPQGYTLGMGTPLSGANVVSPFTLMGLTPNTVYDYYVRTVCPGSVSNWNGPFTFTSLFLPSAVPYNTGFENIEFQFLGWRAERATTTIGNFWQTVNFGAGSAAVQEGAFAARVGAGVTTAQSNDWILSRGINLTAGSTATISFFVAMAQTGTTTPAGYNLTVGTAQNVAAQTTVIVNSPTFTNTAYELRTHTYTVPATGVYYFGIQNAIPTNAAGAVTMLLDNFTVNETLSIDSVNAALNVSVYPNPANDTVYISSDKNTFNNVSVVDMNGRVVKTASFDNASTLSMDIAELSSGVYFLNINSAEGTVNRKLIKN